MTRNIIVSMIISILIFTGLSIQDSHLARALASQDETRGEVHLMQYILENNYAE